MTSNKKYIIIAIIIAIIMITLVVILPSVYSMPYFSTSSETSYDNSNTWLTSTTVQGALDELYNQKYGCPNGQICLKSPYVYTANISDEVTIGQSIPNAIAQYETPEDAMSALKIASGGTTDYPFFLKHKLSNDIVTESYVGFVVTPNMAANNTGMTAGMYYLKVADNGASFLDNAKTVYDAFGNNCPSNPYVTAPIFTFDCFVSGLSINVGSNGSVYARGLENSWCGFDANENHSYCHM